jgi:hypothetical protein
VPQRVAALPRPPPPLRTGHLGTLLTLTLAILLGATAVERTGETLFEHAKASPVASAKAR